jgi:hypothetical protein
MRRAGQTSIDICPTHFQIAHAEKKSIFTVMSFHLLQSLDISGTDPSSHNPMRVCLVLKCGLEIVALGWQITERKIRRHFLHSFLL